MQTGVYTVVMRCAGMCVPGMVTVYPAWPYCTCSGMAILDQYMAKPRTRTKTRPESELGQSQN